MRMIADDSPLSFADRILLCNALYQEVVRTVELDSHQQVCPEVNMPGLNLFGRDFPILVGQMANPVKTPLCNLKPEPRSL